MIDQRMRNKTTGVVDRYYYLTDGLGSVVALVNSAGSTTPVSTYRYDPYGNDVAVSETVVSRFRFAGGLLSTTLGLYKFGERWYDPSTARWLQQDMLEDPLATRGWNRYDYAGDDPVNFADPNGTCICLGKCAKHLAHKLRDPITAAQFGIGLAGVACAVGGIATGGVGFVACGLIASTAGTMLTGVQLARHPSMGRGVKTGAALAGWSCAIGAAATRLGSAKGLAFRGCSGAATVIGHVVR